MSDRRLILGIDTSCDDTSAAVVADGRDILSNVVSSQIEVHERFGSERRCCKRGQEKITFTMDELYRKMFRKRLSVSLKRSQRFWLFSYRCYVSRFRFVGKEA